MDANEQDEERNDMPSTSSNRQWNYYLDVGNQEMPVT